MSYEIVSPLLGRDGLRMEVVTDANVSEKVMSEKIDILVRFGYTYK